MRADAIAEGDLIDLADRREASPFMTATDKMCAEFELFEVVEVEREGGKILIGVAGLFGLIPFQPGARLDCVPWAERSVARRV